MTDREEAAPGRASRRTRPARRCDRATVSEVDGARPHLSATHAPDGGARSRVCSIASTPRTP